MDPTLSSQAALDIGTSQLPMTPDEALAEIQPFLDFPISDPSNSRVVQSFRQHYTEHMETNNLSWNLIGYLYEQLMFLRGGDITPPTVEDICQSRFFRPNMDFSLEGITQPAGIQIHVFTTSDSKEVHLDDVSSMVLELSSPSGSLEKVYMEALKFMKKIPENTFKNLRHLKLSRFCAGSMLWESLSNFRLDWLHGTCPLFIPSIPFNASSSGFKRLHLKLEKTCELRFFPFLPYPLQELSLHFSDPADVVGGLDLSYYTCLEKM